MRIALYIEDGFEQIALTPETPTETNILAKLSNGARDITIKRGGFYHCQGGWVREHEQLESTMIVLQEPRTGEGA
jgi:hypothetical protein